MEIGASEDAKILNTPPFTSPPSKACHTFKRWGESRPDGEVVRLEGQPVAVN